MMVPLKFGTVCGQPWWNYQYAAQITYKRCIWSIEVL